MKRILIVKLWALGDILMATPLLTALKSRWPDCQITWLADKDYAGILEDNPLLEELIPFDSGKWRRHWRYGQFLAYAKMTREIRRELKKRRFDITISLTGEKWWSVWFLVNPVRIGLFPRPNPGRMGKLYTHAIARNDGSLIHNTAHYLRPAMALGIPGPYDQRMVLGISPAHQQAVERFLLEQDEYDPGKPLLILHPGASQETKCWPPDYYAAVAKSLINRYNIVITGSPKEQGLADAIVAAMDKHPPKSIVATGNIREIGETAALISRAEAVITGDTSALHMASALGTPFVAIYGSTRPNDNAPLYGAKSLIFDDTVPCSPCYKARCPLSGAAFMQCQKAVTPEQVIQALNLIKKESYEPSPAF